MKLLIFVGISALLFVANGAFAACSGTQVMNTTTTQTLTQLLSGNTVCVLNPNPENPPKIPPRDTWLWQEEHLGAQSGQLWDYKLGDNHPVDPRKRVGNWAVRGTGTGTVVVHSYGTGGTYLYSVWDNGGGSYSFCDRNGALVTDCTVATGTNVGCP